MTPILNEEESEWLIEFLTEKGAENGYTDKNEGN